MGEPAIPTAADRKETRELATAIVESVRNDEAMPHPFDVIEVHGAGMMVHLVHVKEHMFRLAQEIDLLRAEGAATNERNEAALDYLRRNTGDTQEMRNAEQIAVGNMDSEGNWIR